MGRIVNFAVILENDAISKLSCWSMQVKPNERSRALLGQVSDIDLRLLKVFKSVVDCGGMTAAELELNIGTSTVSRHIKDLEARLSLVLCRRGRAGFALTADGQRIYEETLRLLAAVEAFRSSVDDIHLRLGGQIDVAVFDKTATNPLAHMDDAIARFTSMAPDVRLNVHVGSINAIERGVLDGVYQVGVIPVHRSSKALAYADLFGETMFLYCGSRHPLFNLPHTGLTWAKLRSYAFAGLGFHSPNMELSHRARLVNKATGFDQEAIAMLVLSGRYLGFLPNHYARVFEKDGLMQAIESKRFRYSCRFVSILRRSPEPTRATLMLQECLVAAHQAT